MSKPKEYFDKDAVSRYSNSIFLHSYNLDTVPGRWRSGVADVFLEVSLPQNPCLEEKRGRENHRPINVCKPFGL
jgi:hypothetical protein